MDKDQELHALLATLQGEDIELDSAEARATAAATLGDLGDPRAVEPLIAALSDKNWRVRCAAAESLGKLGDKRAVEPLIAALKHADRNTQTAAAEALGKLGDPRSIEPLVSLSHRSRDSTRAAATKAFGEFSADRVTSAQRTTTRKERRLALPAAVRGPIKRGMGLLIAGVVIFLLSLAAKGVLVTGLRYLSWIVLAAGLVQLAVVFAMWLRSRM
jgi:HEAT repeat protein